MTQRIIFKEYQEKTIQEINENFNNESFSKCSTELNNSKITIEDLEKIKKYLEKINLSSALKISMSSIKAKSFVGVIKYKNIQIEILPKLISDIDNNTKNIDEKEKVKILNNLIFMLSYTQNLLIRTSDCARLSKTTNPFLEILIREYADSLFDSLKRLTPRSYIREEDNLKYLKGKLKFIENIKYNSVNQSKFYCEYDEFSENCTLNQLFLYVSSCLYNISKDSKNRSKLKFIIDYFCNIKPVYFDLSKCNKIKLARNQQMFKKPFQLAKMFVEHSSVDLSLNKFENITILWDMNKLFEEFIYQLIRRKLPQYQAKGQYKKALLKNRNRNTYVDIMINEKIIIDTKYKKFETMDDIANEDIFQVTTYSLLHDNALCNKIKGAILLYPLYKKGQNPNIEDKLNSEITYSIAFKTIDLMYSNLKQEIQKNSNNSTIIQELKTIIEQGLKGNDKTNCRE